MFELSQEWYQNCGNIGYKLEVSDNTQSKLASVIVESGIAKTKQVIDDSLIGEHLLTFSVFLVDKDPNSIHAQKLPLSL